MCCRGHKAAHICTSSSLSWASSIRKRIKINSHKTDAMHMRERERREREEIVIIKVHSQCSVDEVGYFRIPNQVTIPNGIQNTPSKYLHPPQTRGNSFGKDFGGKCNDPKSYFGTLEWWFPTCGKRTPGSTRT
jgi:hypothetical protein